MKRMVFATACLVLGCVLSGCASDSLAQSDREQQESNNWSEEDFYELKEPMLDPAITPLCEKAGKGDVIPATYDMLNELFDNWEAQKVYSCDWNTEGRLMYAQNGFAWKDPNAEMDDQYFRYLASFSWDKEVDPACVVVEEWRILIVDTIGDRTLGLRPALYCGFLQ